MDADACEFRPRSLDVGPGIVIATLVDGSTLEVSGNTAVTATAIGVGLIKTNQVTHLE